VKSGKEFKNGVAMYRYDPLCGGLGGRMRLCGAGFSRYGFRH
jgi:hypothetical protein